MAALHLGDLDMGEPQPWASEAALVVKNPAANAGNIRDAGSVPGSGRFRGEGNSNPLQCSCLENPVGRGAWRAAILSRTRPNWLGTHTALEAQPLPPRTLARSHCEHRNSSPPRSSHSSRQENKSVSRGCFHAMFSKEKFYKKHCDPKREGRGTWIWRRRGTAIIENQSIILDLNKDIKIKHLKMPCETEKLNPPQRGC